MLKGTQAQQIITVQERIPLRQRNKVREVTLDMAANMAKAVRRWEVFLFPRYPLLQKAYQLALRLSSIFTICKSKTQAFKRLALWYNDVEASAIESFNTVARYTEPL